MNEVAVNLSLVSNVWIKQLVFPTAGTIMVSHVHTFDHQTLLASGRLRVFVDGCARDFQAPQIIVIRQGQSHVFEALEDQTVAYCVHALRSSERVEDIIDPRHEVHLSHTYPISAGVPNTVNPLL